MAKGNREKPKEGTRKAQAALRRFYFHTVVLALLMVGMATGVYWFFSAKKTSGQPAAPSVARDAPQVQNRFDRLNGRWVRPDGGYVLEIKDVDAAGKLTAGYFNPRPINVSRAEAVVDGDNLRILIELRYVNYPGATYHLIYDPEKDQLRGIYRQPALGQSFQIFFVREK